MGAPGSPNLALWVLVLGYSLCPVGPLRFVLSPSAGLCLFPQGRDMTTSRRKRKKAASAWLLSFKSSPWSGHDMEVGAKPPSTTTPRGRGADGWWGPEGTGLKEPPCLILVQELLEPSLPLRPLGSSLGGRGPALPHLHPQPAAPLSAAATHLRGQTAGVAARCALGFPQGQVFLPQGTALLPAPRTPAGGRAIRGWDPGVGGGRVGWYGPHCG